jgi:hypothetical protein
MGLEAEENTNDTGISNQKRQCWHFSYLECLELFISQIYEVKKIRFSLGLVSLL